ncbi:hypothetical protein OBBRIDRAFT_809203 [Obba rivulosa]|uniref:RRM domain-containing protein n=1 Tax=Obba rivulosa TaxID=1052685 RepID=A0A8E2DUL7_9APHY|nr:hypothetical protein OBBRIDRAFT_809203 [Obba rivulosa]
MSEETITKRLHVSGLTPAITTSDLSQRLASFGTVKSIDGFGTLDAVGQPRKFGYITIETTKSKLSRCMNLLSGVTWKGAKLRIGEAKPDFRERIAREHEVDEASDNQPPKKKRRLPHGVQGVHAPDMSPVTPENAASRPGWHVTPLGRIVRPIRIRPEHPLPPPLTTSQPAAKAKGKKADETKRKRKRAKDPPTRARRRTIDPLKWGSTHLKGAFLEAVVVDRQNAPVMLETQDGYDESDESSEDENESNEEESGTEPRLADVSMNEAETSTAATPAPASAKPAPAPNPKSVEQIPTTVPSAKLAVQNSVKAPAPTSVLSEDLIQEKEKTLGLLASIFGDKGDADWGDKESISDVDMEELTSRDPEYASESHELEQASLSEADEADVEIETDVETETEEQTPPQPERLEEQSKPPPHPARATGLKDLFAPREEDAGFSLLGHLDLDLELDEEVEQQISVPARAAAVPQVPVSVSATTYLPDFDPKRPFFFPLPPDERNRSRARDALDPANWRTFFYRTESADEIRKRWEETRGELTSGWKRRHREAVKSRRRRGGVGGDGE